MDTPRAIPESHPLHRLFRGLTEYAFMNELGSATRRWSATWPSCWRPLCPARPSGDCGTRKAVS